MNCGVYAEHVQVALPIITSSVLMGGAAFLEQQGPAISHILEGLIGNVKERAMLVLVSVTELLLQAHPEVASRVLQPALARLLACLLYGQETGLVVASKSLALVAYSCVLMHAGRESPPPGWGLVQPVVASEGFMPVIHSPIMLLHGEGHANYIHAEVASRAVQPALVRLLACLLCGQETGLFVASESL